MPGAGAAPSPIKEHRLAADDIALQPGIRTPMALRLICCLLVGLSFVAAGMANAQDAASDTVSWQRQLASLHARAESAAVPALADALVLEQQLAGAGAVERLQFYRELCHVASLAREDAQSERAASRLAEAAPGRSAAAAGADAETCRAELEFERGQRLIALRTAQHAMEAARGVTDPGTRYYAGFMLGYIADRDNEFASAMEGYALADAAAEAEGSLADQVKVGAEMARLYKQLEQGERAVETADAAIARAARLGDPEVLALAWAAKYYCLPDDASPASYEALQQARRYARQSGNASGELVMQTNFADYLLDIRHYQEAVGAATEALHMAARTVKSIHNDTAYATALANRGFARLYLRDPAAHQDVEQALALLNAEDKPQASQVYLDYANALADTGDFRRAWVAMQSYKKISDELLRSDQQNRVLQLREMFAAERLERQNVQLRGENELKSAALQQRVLEQRVAWLASALAALALVSIALLYRRVRVSYRALRVRHRELDFRSRHDPLTGLLNRSAFAEEVERYLARPSAQHPQAKRHQALLLIDIDRFKQVNDSYGHAAGDLVLRGVADRLRQALRDSDVVVRWGGEEFLVLLPEVQDGTLEAVVARVLRIVAGAPVKVAAREIAVAVSVGFARLPVTVRARALHWERLLNVVDLLLYEAKSGGRNCAVGLPRPLSLESDEELAQLEADLPGARRAGRLPLVRIPGPSGPRLQIAG
jgi:diguanylate cyclase (GGDEF)-like protein